LQSPNITLARACYAPNYPAAPPFPKITIRIANPPDVRVGIDRNPTLPLKVPEQTMAQISTLPARSFASD
jgi:hypothetical protein